MNLAGQLALRLFLAADAMFVIGLFGASRVLPHDAEAAVGVNSIIVVLLFGGRIMLRLKPRKHMRGSLMLVAILCSAIEVAHLFNNRPASDVGTLLQWVFAFHLIAIATAAFAFADELALLWNFVLGFGFVLWAVQY